MIVIGDLEVLRHGVLVAVDGVVVRVDIDSRNYLHIPRPSQKSTHASKMDTDTQHHICTQFYIKEKVSGR